MSMRHVDAHTYEFTFPEEKYFNGNEFIAMHKNAEFLQERENLKKILMHSDELCTHVGALPSTRRTKVLIHGMFLKPGVQLELKVSGSRRESDVEEASFTARRLVGLTAAVVSRDPFPLNIPLAAKLGLRWGPDEVARMLCLASVPGAELFIDHFGVYPFICALKKYRDKIINEEELRRIAKTPTLSGRNVFEKFQDTYSEPNVLAKYFGGHSFDIQAIVDSLPYLGVY